jgi:hypothetical protein
MLYVVASVSSRNAIAPFSGPAVPRSWLEEGVESFGVRVSDRTTHGYYHRRESKPISPLKK